ncbi:MAG: hypothetical protein ABH951_01460 [Patescibacteria group bacterium]
MSKFFKITLFFISVFFLFFLGLRAEATTGTIDAVSFTSFLCSDVACTTGSRIVWRTTNGTSVTITDTAVTGNLWGENVGWINLSPVSPAPAVADCAHSHVVMEPANTGVLTGCAWGENTGWINFKPPSYGGGVTINPTSGYFSGWAWAQNYGWIKFDCSAGVNYCVKTSWEPTITIITGGGGDDDTPTFCELYPNDPSCITPAFCVLYPTHPSCIILTFCQMYPEFCVQPTFCELNPNDPSCLEPTFCELNPNDLSCLGLPFCELNPDHPSCNPPPPCEGPNCFPPEPPDDDDNIIDEILTPIEDIFNETVSNIQDFVKNNFTDSALVKINTGLKLTAIGSAVIAGIVALASVLFLNPLSASELILIPFRLWSLLLSALGLKKRIKPWGTVYDSVTKQPLDPVYVSLVNLEGEEVTSSITDIDGRYGFYVEAGVYKVIPKKTNYIFPSHALADQFKDEFYQDLYFGDYMNIATGQIIVNNVPMDPVNFDWNEFAKNKKQLFKFYSRRELIITRILNILFGFGFSVATLALIVSPEKYNIIIFGLYIVMFILRRTKFKLRAKGRIVDNDGTPLSYAFIRVFSVATNVEMIHKVADQMGRYHILLPNGKYYVKIEKKNNDGSYSVVHTSEPLEVVHGTLNRVFNI